MLATVLSTLRHQKVNLFIEKFVQTSVENAECLNEMFTKIEAILILFQVPKIGYFQEWKNWGVKSCVAVPLMLCKSLRKVNK